MARKSFALLTLVVAVVLGLAAPTLAQSDLQVIADGLNNPRGISYGSDGTLYIVESGNGGGLEVMGPFGSPVDFGGSGQLTAVAPDGTKSTLVVNLASMDGGSRGAMDALVTEDSVWLALGDAPLSAPFTMGVVELDRETMRIRRFIDVYAYEAANNPDGDIISTNPSDLELADDGTLFIADASCNCVLTWTAEDGLQTFAAWSIDDNPVPTSVALGPEGDVYVGFLSGFPFPAEGSRIERYSPDGELLQTYEGLTTVVSLLVDDMGTLYAVEYGRFGDAGFEPGTGRLVTVSEAGITPVLEGLTHPYGLAQAPDGTMALVVNSTGEPGSGQVVAVPGM